MEHIQAAMVDFITSKNAGVFVIKGAWGVGKTYFFNDVLERCSDRISAEKYSYVSLFGARSVSDLKKSMLTNSVDPKNSRQDPKIVVSKLFSKLQSLSDAITNAVPAAGEYIPDTHEINFSLSVNNFLVCFDDVERSSDHLKIKEVMALASELKERKSCKVFLILDDSKINDRDYALYREKVVDYEFNFNPTPSFGLGVADIKSIQFSDYIKERITTINCSNIRVMKRAIKLIDDLIPSLEGFHDKTIKDVISSIVLFCCVKERSGLVSDFESLEFFREMKACFFKFDFDEGTSNSDLKDKEKILNEYGFYYVDDKDICLVDGISCGFIDKQRLIDCLYPLERENINSERTYELAEAWYIYRSGFEDNECLLITKLIAAVSRNIDFINFNDLNSAICFLRRLHRMEDADNLIDMFVQKRKTDIESVKNFESLFHMAMDGVDSVLAERLINVKASRVKPDCITLMLKIYEGEYLSDDDLSILAESPTEAYIKFLKENNLPVSIVDKVKPFKVLRAYGDSLRSAIFQKMFQALSKIAEENRLNALRVADLKFAE